MAPRHPPFFEFYEIEKACLAILKTLRDILRYHHRNHGRL